MRCSLCFLKKMESGKLSEIDPGFSTQKNFLVIFQKKSIEKKIYNVEELAEFIERLCE